MGPDPRALNLAIASAYDQVPFDPPVIEALLPGRILASAAVYGCRSDGRDLLDLGCGSGAYLAAAGASLTGRLVGVDLSAAACALARNRCAELGDRAQILEADFLDLDPEALGQFDMIYLLGTLYVVPGPVRDHLLSLVAHCLRPGGVAVIGYYDGVVQQAKAHLYRLVRALLPDGLAPQAAVSQIRQSLASIRALPQGQDPVIGGAIFAIEQLADPDLFHEALNPAFAPAMTVELDRRLASAGIRFLTHVEAAAVGRHADPRGRAVDSEILDLTQGGYHRALFGSSLTNCAPNLAAPGVVWRSSLALQGQPPPVGACGHYLHPETGAQVTVARPLACAVIEAMIEAPGSLPDLIQRAGRSWQAGAAMDQLVDDLFTLWDLRVIWPELQAA